MSAEAEFAALRALSARLGSAPLLVQAAGGNTSLKPDGLKHEGLLWVKASGTWLAEAAVRPILVPVRLAPLFAALATGDAAAETAMDFVAAERNPAGLRPSIETTLHAVLGQRVVVHVHCVETIAWAVRVGAEALLGGRLSGLDWRFIPYVRPGLPLARAILAAGPAEVLVLGNHGLVVAAGDVAAAELLLGEVCRRLAGAPRTPSPPDLAHLAALAAGTGWRVAPDPAIHGAATDPATLAQVRKGSLYPDHVIYLGPGVLVLEAGESVGAALQRQAARGAPPPLLLVPGAGALMRETASPGEVALARCLADVGLRIAAGAEITTLGAAAEAELMGWDAETYRRALEDARA